MIAPRQVFCIIDGAYRRPDVAAAVLAGRFEFAGVERDLGLRPDWLGADLPADEEWRIEWSKFYYGLDLADGYARTGDPAHLDAWLSLVTSWIEQVPVGHDPADVLARRVQNWIYAWNRFDAAGGRVDETTAATVGASITAQLDRLRSTLSAERNHRTLELYALLIGGLALADGVPADAEIVRFAVHELHRNLCVDVLPDGVHRELSSHYHAVVLRSHLGLLVNARRFDIALPVDAAVLVRGACRFLAAVTRPDGSLPQLGDSDDGDYADLLLLAADLLDDPELRFVATRGKEGSAPARSDHEFPDAGYLVQRSPWDDAAYEDARHLVLDVGAVGPSGHGHYDALHVEASAYGRALLVDPGRHTYSEDGPTNWRRWFKGTAAHNTVVVDGMDQTPYQRGKTKGPVAHARRLRGPEADSARIRTLAGQVISPSSDAIHRRRVMFVDDEFWIVEDELVAHDEHEYDLRWHLSSEADGRVEAREGRIEAPGLLLAMSVGDGDRLVVEDGWVAPQYGLREPAPVISLRRRATTTRLVTVVVPVPGPHDLGPIVESAQPGLVRLRRDGIGIEVTWDDGRAEVRS